MTHPLAPKQLQFMLECNAKWNLAHGSVRSGKTVGTLYAFMFAAKACPDSQIYMVGHTSETVYANAVRLLFESPQFAIFRPFCTWAPGRRQLLFFDKTIQILGAKDEGSIGNFQGKTMSLVYCDEMTLYPESIIDMIDTRLSLPHSQGFASMNPSYPTHKIKQWIDKGIEGDINYYELHFTLDDNPFVDEEYKKRVGSSLSGVFYKRNYLGLWCLAAGSIFDFFDREIHVKSKAPACADYFIAGIDYGTSNAFACVLVGVSTGMTNQQGKKLWVEKEYYWDSRKEMAQKTNSEYAEEVISMLEPYAVKQVYIDPSAAAMRLELSRKGIHCVDANNDVIPGIEMTTSEMKKGNLYIMRECKNLIREIEGYVWNERKAKLGEDEPVKAGDHAIDALRYCIATHKVSEYKPFNDSQARYNADDYLRGRFDSGKRKF